MKTKLFALVTALFLLYSPASAQGYAIRITFNTNLRAAASLQARIIETAPAGKILNVVGSDNRWLRINRNGSEIYMADWVSYTRVEESAPTQPQIVSNIDNCCFVDRQCHSDQDWTDGYWAFQNGQCAPPAQTHTQVPTQPVTTTAPDTIPIPAGVDNCCQVNRQCNNDDDWTRGWLAFEHFLCNPPSVTQGLTIQGGAGFVSQVTDGLYLLREYAPQWWKYVTSGLDRIVQDLSNDVPGVYVEKRLFRLDYTDHIPAGYEATHTFDMAAMLVHEACHVHRHEAGLQSGGLPGESDCLSKEIEVYHALDPHSQNSAIAGLKKVAQNILSNIHRPECQWWTGEYFTDPSCR